LSTLTKVFVVLLVVLSIILTSATVVFVNRVDNAADTISALRQHNAEVENAKNTAVAAAEASTANFTQARQQMQAQLNAASQATLTAQQQLADRDVTLAQLRGQLAMQQADIARLTEGLKASEETKNKLQDTVAAQRTEADKNTTQIAQLNAAVSDLTNRLEVTERERRYFQEQFTEAQSQSAKFSAALRDRGVNPQEASTTAGTRQGAPSINGVIRDIKTIANIPYATISVGSSDNVAKGMEFNIIDRDKGDVLGVLTVDTVEPNESTGRLRGPRISEVKPGNEVRTQL
jgi:chromosome segregation ATPase